MLDVWNIILPGILKLDLVLLFWEMAEKELQSVEIYTFFSL